MESSVKEGGGERTKHYIYNITGGTHGRIHKLASILKGNQGNCKPAMRPTVSVTNSYEESNLWTIEWRVMSSGFPPESCGQSSTAPLFHSASYNDKTHLYPGMIRLIFNFRDEKSKLLYLL